MPTNAKRLVLGLRGGLGMTDPRAILRHLVRAKKIEIVRSTLGAAESGLQAALTPRRAGGFLLLIDPALARAQADGAMAHGYEPVGFRRLVRRLRIAHEIGHSFFYGTEMLPPTQPGSSSPVEEEFCDLFAWELCSPNPHDRQLQAWALGRADAVPAA